jgi:hypothetical protein
LVVATDLTGAATVLAGAGITAAAAFAATVGVFVAFDVLLAACGGVATVAGVAAARRIEATAFDASVDRADYAITAVARAAARAAGGTLRPGAASFTVGTPRRLATFACGADSYRARVVIAVAILIGAAFIGAAAVGAAQPGRVAESVGTQGSFAGVGRARISVVADGGLGVATRLLVDAVCDRRAVVPGAAAGRAGLVLAGARKADVIGAVDPVVAVRVVAALTAVAFATLLA